MSKRTLLSIFISFLFITARAEDQQAKADHTKQPVVTQEGEGETFPDAILSGGQGVDSVTDEQCQRAFLGDWTGIDRRISGDHKLTINYNEKKKESLSKTQWAVIRDCIKKIAKEAGTCGCNPDSRVVEPGQGKISGRDRDFVPEFPRRNPITQLPDLFK